ncbi:hypothetical protein DPMN_013038 [Dreissena polymorpha]|uniref:Uncharacterized protein n=1 Tax=Dreissena polymorpha TaxID=45954 RepID=A0A9D4S3X6_DREPO|nr:hypothetical protein DPMN_013038 [Dreissena polymorpha]
MTAVSDLTKPFGELIPANVKKKLSVPFSACPELSMASYFGDHMVLQRTHASSQIWGYADTGHCSHFAGNTHIDSYTSINT